MRKLFILFFFSLTISSCDNNATSNSNKEKSGGIEAPPPIQLAMIVEGAEPSDAMVLKFSNTLNKINTVHPTISEQQVADKLIALFKEAKDEGYKKSFLQFVGGFEKEVQEEVNRGVVSDFDELLTTYTYFVINEK